MSDSDDENDESYVKLYPFDKQVGGHNPLMIYDSQTICKPLVFREYTFYKTIQYELELKDFTPEFKGVVEVTIEKNNDDADDGHWQYVAHRLPSSKEMAFVLEVENLRITKKTTPNDVTFNDKEFISRVEKGWIVKNNRSIYNAYIMLENIICNYKKPCIIDLKMGRRQYSDDACDAKRQRMIKRCESSTSKQLGVRLCGMQYYCHTNKHLIFKDKYFGRNADVDQFKMALFDFFKCPSSNESASTEIIDRNLLDIFIEKLNHLRNCLTEKNKTPVRLYASSLLLIYDAKDAIDDVDRKAIVKIIDFANVSVCTCHKNGATISSSNIDQSAVNQQVVDDKNCDFCKIHSFGPDKGFLFGLNNLIETLKDF